MKREAKENVRVQNRCENIFHPCDLDPCLLTRAPMDRYQKSIMATISITASVIHQIQDFRIVFWWNWKIALSEDDSLARGRLSRVRPLLTESTSAFSRRTRRSRSIRLHNFYSFARFRIQWSREDEEMWIFYVQVRPVVTTAMVVSAMKGQIHLFTRDPKDRIHDT